MQLDRMRFNKWRLFKSWVTDNHYGVIKRQRIALKNGVHLHIKDDEDLLNVLDKMDELEREEIEYERNIRLKALKGERYGYKSV